MRSINEIRKTTFIKINQTIDLINKINNILKQKSEIIPNEKEDVNIISLPYLSNSIDLLEKLLLELNEKNLLVEYLFKKNIECYEKYNLILEKSKV